MSVYLASSEQAGEAPVPGDEVVLVAEAVRLPVERRLHREADAVALAVEDDVARERRRLVVVERDVLEAELVLAAGLQDGLQSRTGDGPGGRGPS